jgi:hypothetical protein
MEKGSKVKSLILICAGSLGSLAFTLSVDAGYFRRYEWAIRWMWGASAALWAGWAVTRPPVTKRLETFGRTTMHAIQILACVFVCFCISLLAPVLLHSGPTVVAAPVQSVQPPQSTTPSQQNTTNGDGNNSGNVNQSGNNNTAIVGNNNRTGPTYNFTKKNVTDVGWLKPGHTPTPPPPDPDCPIDEAVKRGELIVFLGTFVGTSSHFPLTIVEVGGHDLLKVDKDKAGHLTFSGEVFNASGDAVVVIEKNKFTVSDEAFIVDASPDKTSLRVTVKRWNESVLDIEYLNAHTLKIAGHFRYHGADINFSDNGTEASRGNSGMTLGRGCSIQPAVIFSF